VSLALFPSGAMLGLLFLDMGRGSGSGLVFFFDTGHIPLPAVNWDGRGTENNSWDTKSDLINLLPHR